MSEKILDAARGIFSATGESNRFLQKFKAAREKKWSLTRTDHLWDVADLGFYLMSVGRLEEACEVFSYPIQSLEFKGDTFAWEPVRMCYCGLYQAKKLLGNTDQALRAVEYLRSVPRATVGLDSIAPFLIEVRDYLHDSLTNALDRILLIGVLRITCAFLTEYDMKVRGYDAIPVDELRLSQRLALQLLGQVVNGGRKCREDAGLRALIGSMRDFRKESRIIPFDIETMMQYRKYLGIPER